MNTVEINENGRGNDQSPVVLTKTDQDIQSGFLAVKISELIVKHGVQKVLEMVDKL